MKKKVLIISLIIVFVFCLLLVVFLVGKRVNKGDSIEKFDDTVVSSITLDINPSIKIELNKDEKVVNIITLNEDAKEIVNDDFKGKDLKEEIKILSDKLVEKSYLEDATIIVSTEGINSEDVKTIIVDSIEDKSIKYEVLIPTITESAKEIANKYNITEGKAAYLESIKKENPELNFEEISSSSIKEIKQKVEDIKNEEKNNKLEEKETASGSNNNVTKPSSTSRPTNAQDKSGGWCNYNSTKSPTDTFNYPEDKGLQEIKKIADTYFNTLESGFVNSEIARIDDKRSSYCIGYRAKANTTTKIYYAYIDSVTGEIFDTKTEDIPAPSITEDKAIQIGIEHFNLTDISSCDLAPQVYYSMNNGKMRYTFGARCNGIQYSLIIDANSGALSDSRTW